METRDWYRGFAEVECVGSSPIYERTALAVARDDALLARLDALPTPKRQPNLLFAACRLLGAPLGDAAETLRFVHDRWSNVRAVMEARSTQTNEPARTGTFLPILAALDRPIALVEVGASAGLCLFPDRYRIGYDDAPPVGPPDSPVTIRVETSGPVPIPRHGVEVAWRSGVDRHPLDVRDPDAVAWLDACIWPEHEQRRQRLRAAAEVVAADPPDLVTGDLVETIDELLAAVPAGLHPVVFHSAVLAYLRPQQRAAFAARMAARPEVLWLSNEGPGVLEAASTSLTPPAHLPGRSYFVLARGGRAVLGISHPHGAWLRWAA